MAPYTRNAAKKQKQNRKKAVRFNKREYPVKKSETVIKPSENYENLILHYLTKLKRLFGNPQLMKERNESKTSTKVRADEYEARKSSSRPRDHETNMDMNEDVDMDMDNEIRDEVYRVVNAAIQYGFANNVLEKRGNCFIMKDRRNQKVAYRQATPGPNVITYDSQCNCRRCKSRQSLMRTIEHSIPSTKEKCKCSKCLDNRPKTVDATNLRLAKTFQTSGRKLSTSNFKNKRSSRSISSTNTSRPYNDRVKKACNCSKCQTLDMKRRITKK